MADGEGTAIEPDGDAVADALTIDGTRLIAPTPASIRLYDRFLVGQFANYKLGMGGFRLGLNAMVH